MVNICVSCMLIQIVIIYNRFNIFNVELFTTGSNRYIPEKICLLIVIFDDNGYENWNGADVTYDNFSAQELAPGVSPQIVLLEPTHLLRHHFVLTCGSGRNDLGFEMR